MSKTAVIFALAVAAQVLILLGVPAQKAYTRATGRSVILKVQPVDPYNILSGYYVTLGYQISRPESFPDQANLSYGEPVYAIVEEQADGLWHPVTLAHSFPATLPTNQVAISGRYSGSRIDYGIEEFYIPENKRDAIAQDLRQHLEQARVEVKVDARGNAALVRLMIENRIYEY